MPSSYDAELSVADEGIQSPEEVALIDSQYISAAKLQREC